MAKEIINGNAQLVKSEIIPALTPAEPTPLQIIKDAIAGGMDPDKLTKMFDLYERDQKRKAEQAFIAAMNEFKKDRPRIMKSKTAQVESNRTGQKFEYKYADLFEVSNSISDALSKYGLSHRFETRQEIRTIGPAAVERVVVTCILSHVAGHSERTTLEGCADQTGSKNAIQAIASTVTYLERYTLLAATGCAASDTDSDGTAAPEAPSKYDDLREKLDWIANCTTIEELQRIYTEAYKSAHKAKDQKAMLVLIEAKDKRKRELQ
jgi:hypothetical protein